MNFECCRSFMFTNLDRDVNVDDDQDFYAMEAKGWLLRKSRSREYWWSL